MLEGSVGRAKGSASTEPHTLPGHKLNMALWHTNQKPKIRRRTSYYLLPISPPHPLEKGNQEKQFSCRTLRFLREGSRWTEQAPACQRPGTSSSRKQFKFIWVSTTSLRIELCESYCWNIPGKNWEDGINNFSQVTQVPVTGFQMLDLYLFAQLAKWVSWINSVKRNNIAIRLRWHQSSPEITIHFVWG